MMRPPCNKRGQPRSPLDEKTSRSTPNKDESRSQSVFCEPRLMTHNCLCYKEMGLSTGAAA